MDLFCSDKRWLMTIHHYISRGRGQGWIEMKQFSLYLEVNNILKRKSFLIEFDHLELYFGGSVINLNYSLIYIYTVHYLFICDTQS